MVRGSKVTRQGGLRRHMAGALIAGLAWFVLFAAGAQAATPFEQLRDAKPGDRVRVAPGLTLVPTELTRSQSVVRVRAGRLRIGGVATGRGVRAVATPTGVRIVGGRIGVARSLTDRDYTIPSTAPISVTWAAAGPTVASGRLAALPLQRQKAKARAAADVTEPEVEQALPAPPAGERWRFGFALNASGVVVRVFLGDGQVGSGLVRYDGSYRMSLALTDHPVLGAKVTAAGEVSGRSLSDPAPVAGIGGRVDGQMQVAQQVSVGDGTLAWDTDGLHVDATAKLTCPDGGIAVGATSTVKTDKDWTVKVAGQPSTDGCAVSQDARIDAQSVGGELTSAAGEVTGAITAATGAGDAIQLDRVGTRIVGPTLRFTARGMQLGGGLQVPCPRGGGMVAGLDVTVPYDLNFERDWSATVSAKTAGGGCAITNELALGADTAVAVTIGQKQGRLGIDLSTQATIRTTLVPTKTFFKVVFRLSARAGQFSSYVEAGTDGAAFSGAVKSDGTFDFRFNINDLQIADAKIVVNGNITRADPRGKVDIDFQSDISGNIQLDKNFAIRGVSLGIVGNEFRFGAVIRMKCTKGWYELGASGELTGKGNFRLDITALAGDCRVGHLLRFDGQTWTGTMSWTDGVFDVDIRIAIASMNLDPIRDPKMGTLKMDLYGTTAVITNRCDGCGQEKLRIELDGRAKIGLTFPFSSQPVVLDSRLRVLLDFDGLIATAFYVGLTDVYMNGVKSSLEVVLEGQLIRAIGNGFSTKPAPTAPPTEADEPVGAADIGGPLRLARVQTMRVSTRTSRPRVQVVLSRRSPVTIELERRRCARGTCAWRIVAFRVVRADAKRTARFTSPLRLGAGTYRAVARPGAAGSGRPVVRRFSIR